MRDPQEQALPEADAKPWYKKLGPGLITGAADDDPSGIGTYSQAGAQFGYSMLWTLFFTYPLMVAIQLISARIGRVSGQGVCTHIRRHYPRWLLYSVVAMVWMSNTINIAADLSAMGDALGLLIDGPTRYYAAAFGVISLLLEIYVPYSRYVQVLKWLTLALFAYVATVFVIGVPWSQVISATLLPRIVWKPEYLTTLVAVLGTTISPYLFIWQAAQEVEEQKIDPNAEPLKKAPEQAKPQLERIKFDTYIGMGVSNLVGFFIILATAATLNMQGITDIQSSAQAASALKPIAGESASLLFAIGIIGTGFLGVPVLAGSAAYAFAGAFRWNEGLEQKPSAAKEFYSIIALSTIIGVALGFTPMNPIKALYWGAVISGVISVPIMAVMMLMAVRPNIMGQFTISRSLKIAGWLAMITMGGAVLAMFVTWKF
jgi:NRAMP (natural resistance-associated macrophage protein)-like metal ion transporter